jgi:hypothetical protein
MQLPRRSDEKPIGEWASWPDTLRGARMVERGSNRGVIASR